MITIFIASQLLGFILGGSLALHREGALWPMTTKS